MSAESLFPTSSLEIARKSRSNLAIALYCLPGERKRDMISFYAFCRVLDDIADDPASPVEVKRDELSRWRQAIITDDKSVHPTLSEALDLVPKYQLDRELLVEILDGMASDLERERFETWPELLAYCYKVASAVGLVSIEIFGYRNPLCRDYAINLGYALQLTNILRDVGQDAQESGRIYLPADLLAIHKVSDAQILGGHYDEKFHALMQDIYDRARAFFASAAALLPAEDRRTMIAAEMMACVYGEILEKLRRQGFRVFDHRVRLHPLRKALILGAFVIKRLIGAS